MIEAKDLKKTYKMGKTRVKALRGVNFSMKEGEFTVIAGPSGSGKTTLLNIIGLIDSPDDGEVIFNGENISSLSEKKKSWIRREKIGFIFQNFNLIPVLSAYENVDFALIIAEFSARKRKALVEKYLKRVGLWDRKKHKPGELSGGEKQRVAIARALVKGPSLVVADEPTANLDSETTDEVVSLMRDINHEEGTTFLIASHDPIVIAEGEKILKIRDGKVDGGET